MAREKLSESLHRLFLGLGRAYSAVTGHGGAGPKGKVEAKYRTFRSALTPAEWEQHLAGKMGLVPVPIRDDDTASWGAIDVDEYDVDLPALAARVGELNLPLTTCRSKSGGAHLFLFLFEPAPAAELIGVLEDYAAALGYAGVEVFPKQEALTSERDVGNGIAAPYRGGADSLEYALGDDGEALSPTEFVALARARTRAVHELPEAPEAAAADLEGAPPCLVRWVARGGAGPGQRNDAAFDLGIYCARRWPDEWRDRFQALVRRLCRPALPPSELTALMRSVERRKTYSYRAKCKGPMCRPAACRRAEYGRDPSESGADDPGVPIDGLRIVETDPKTYIVRIGARSMEIPPEILYRNGAFCLAAFAQLDLMVRPVKPSAWRKILEELLKGAERVEAPDDATPRGALRQHLSNFMDQRLAADREKLRLGHAWFDAERGRYWFGSNDFFDHLQRRRVQATRAAVYGMVHAAGGGHHRLRVGRSVMRLWWIPGDAPEEPESVPAPDLTPSEDGD